MTDRIYLNAVLRTGVDRLVRQMASHAARRARRVDAEAVVAEALLSCPMRLALIPQERVDDEVCHQWLHEFDESHDAEIRDDVARRSRRVFA